MAADPKKRRTGAKSRLLGEALETYTLAELRKGGVIAHRIHTPSTVYKGRRVFTDKVCGDFFGIGATGGAVLVECKHRTGKDGEPRRPVPSDFAPHQIDSLREWHNRGGLAMVAYWKNGKVEFEMAVQIVGNP